MIASESNLKNFNLPQTLRYKNWLIIDIGVFLVCGLSFFFSWIESRVNLDSLNWGVMYDAALGIKNGVAILIVAKEVA